MARYIFITGGVASSLGKGVAAASLGALLQARGYRVRLRKLDPYLNIDPGTMSPFQHGECFVTDDGTEADLDLGHYERFTGNPARNSDNVTTGRIYRDIIARERRGDFLGATVQVIPHVTDAIKSFICDNNSDVDFVLCEIGGTVGDIEGLPFFEAIRQLGIDLPRGSTAYIHLTLMPYIASAGEMKTKPTQHSVKELRSIGIQPDILMVRCEQEIPDDLRRKLSLFCNVPKSAVIPAIDVDSIYKVPVAYSNAGLDEEVLKVFKLEQEGKTDLRKWEDIAKRLSHPEGQVTIGIVGKYTGLKDAYKSLIEALIHGGIAHNVEVQIKWINSELFDNNDDPAPFLTDVQGILIPGGFGERGSLGKISAIRFARERAIPFLGICFGMQMAVVEIARNVLGLSQANSTEFGPCEEPVIGLLREWETGSQRQERSEDSDLGGTMRLGSFPAQLKQGSLIHQIYGQTEIHERHRHRYEVNIGYRDQLRAGGLEFSGMSPDGRLPEIVEFSRNHPWFVGVQFHPELKSRPFEPHPLYASFVSAAIRHGRLV